MEKLLEGWQAILDLVAETQGFNAVTLHRKHNGSLNCLLASEPNQGLYHRGQLLSLKDQSYDQWVAQSGLPFSIDNTKDDQYWKNQLEVNHNIIAYAGVPIRWPDGTLFGTLSAHCLEPHKWDSSSASVLEKIQTNIESGLQLLTKWSSDIFLDKDQFDPTEIDPLDLYQQSQDISLKMHEQDSLLHQALETGRSGAWELDIKNRVINWSKETYEMLGFPKDKKTTLRFCKSLIPLSQQKAFREAIRQTVKTGKPFRMALDVKTADGSLHHFSQRGESILNDKGDIERIVGVAQDANELSRDKIAFTETEAELEEAYKFTDVGYWKVDFQTNKIFWSDRTYQILDIPIGTPITMDLFESVIHPDDFENYSKKRKVLEDPSSEIDSYSFEHRTVPKNGKVRWISSQVQGIRDEKGNLIRAFGSILDVTDIKRVESELRQLQFAIKHAEQQFWIVDENAQIRFVNPKVCSDTGYSKEELETSQVFIVNKDIDLNWFTSLWERCKEKGSETFELTTTRKDGTTFPMRIMVSLFFDGTEYMFVAFGQDLTKEKETLKRLEQTQFVFDHSNDEIYFEDKSSNIQYANLTTRKHLGLDEDATELGSILDLNAVLTIDDLKEIYKKAKEDGYVNFKTIHRRSDGTTFPVDLTIFPVPSEEGDLFCVFARDISELEKSQLRLETIWEVAKIVHWEYNPKTDEYYYDRLMAELLFEQKDRITNYSTLKEVFDFIHPDDRETYIEEVERAIREKQENKFLSCRIVVNGKIKYLRTVVHQEFDENGDMTISYGVHMDVTEQERLYEAIRLAGSLAASQGQDFFDKLARGTIELLGADELFIGKVVDRPDGPVIQTVTHYIEGRKCNDLQFQLKGTPCEKAIQKSFLFVPEKIREVFVDCPLLEKKGAEAMLGFPLYDSVGKTVGIFSALFNKPTEDSIIYKHMANLFGQRVGTEIERGFYEEHLIDARQLAENANLAKSAFLANMSHEIRTPLNAILGYIDLMSDDNLAKEKRHDYLNTVYRNGKHLLELISDILDISKVEADRIELSLESISLIDLIAEIENSMRVRAEERLLNFNVAYLTKLPASFETDRLRLKQILMNLLGNAIKFTDEGSVELEIKIIPEEFDGQPGISFAVIDTGIGIDKKNMNRVFDPFSQADGSMARRFGGTGLGLAISRSLAVTMKGYLKAESTIGQGSRFELILPVGDIEKVSMVDPNQFKKPKKTIPEPEAKNRLKDRHILLAEDGPDNRRLIEILLRNAGAEVDLAKDGIEAIEQCLKNKYDLILMDIQMPNMDGLEATRILYNVHNCKTPIVALTANATTEDRQRCLEAGCQDYLTKPIERKNFFQVIKEVLENSEKPKPTQ
jgi:PAS domain S-box-containing protein